MPEPHSRDVPADDTADATSVTRRDFGKTTLGVVAVASGLGLSGVADIAASTPAQAAAQAATRTGPPPHAKHRILRSWERRSITGAENNEAHPDWGMAETIYPRVAPAAYLDGRGEAPTGPNGRYISNRILNDTGANIYSPRNVSTWGFVWGQFLDHTIAMRRGRRQTGEDGEAADIPTTHDDPMEQFRNDIGFVFMNRSIPAPGTGENNPREQINLLSSYIDAATVYGSDEARLNWLREGPADGNQEHSGARLLMRDGYLPRRNIRGNPDAAPTMVFGAMPDPGLVMAAGDPRANENVMIIATHTLFAREHNRIVARLPRKLSEEDKFQIARAVVIAELQYITYNEFLPALGVSLPRYTGYRPRVNTAVTNEFATIGYRAHSMISRALEVRTEAWRYDPDTVAWLKTLGVDVTHRGKKVELVVPHGFATFFQPDLMVRLELGPVLQGIGLTPMTRNDELVINEIRSLNAADTPDFQIMNDLTAVDIHRGRDHGFPTYNEIRHAYGLRRKTSFRDITGEECEDFPADPLLTPGDEIDNLHSLDWLELHDSRGRPTTPAANNAVRGVRRTPLAARLKAVYGDVDKVDAFVGMICEPHRSRTEFGELQLAIWRRQFTALRDGDRFFYQNYPFLRYVRRYFGIDYRTTLGDLIARNTDIPRHRLQRNVFFASSTASPLSNDAKAGDAGAPDTKAGDAKVRDANAGDANATAMAAGIAGTAIAGAAMAVPAMAATPRARAGSDRAVGLEAGEPGSRKQWYCGRAEL